MKDVETGIFARPAGGSLVEFGLKEKGVERIKAEIASNMASDPAARLLVSAQVAYAATGQALPTDVTKLNWPVVRPDKFAVVSSHGLEDDHQNRKILVLGFGDCCIGFSIPHEDIEYLTRTFQLAVGPEAGRSQ